MHGAIPYYLVSYKIYSYMYPMLSDSYNCDERNSFCGKLPYPEEPVEIVTTVSIAYIISGSSSEKWTHNDYVYQKCIIVTGSSNLCDINSSPNAILRANIGYLTIGKEIIRKYPFMISTWILCDALEYDNLVCISITCL
jgi:hypothetical protein